MATTDTYSTPGDFTWVCPTGVTSVVVKCWGPGGAGENGTSGTRARGGGGGGAFAQDTITVVPGQSYAVHVGAGGLAGANTGDSFFVDALTVYARGGSHGSGFAGGGGGTVGASVGATRFAGGDGAGAGIGKTGGGGGGGGAGDSANGTIGTAGGLSVATTGGPGGAGGSAGGGAGGAGGDNTLNGVNGTACGGGGGGAGGGTTTLAGNGADGKVTLTYTPDTTYAGPKLELLVSRVDFMAASDLGANPISNTANLVGAADATLDSVSVRQATATESSDFYALRFMLPPQHRRGIVLGFTFTGYACQASPANNNDNIMWNLTLMNSLDERVGATEAMHELTSNASAGPDDLGTSKFTEGPESVCLFTTGLAQLGGAVQYLEQLGGIYHSVQQLVSNPGGAQTASMDAFKLVVWYTPADPGTRIAGLTFSSLDTLNGASLGVAADGAAGTEVDWTNISNALSIDTSRANVTLAAQQTTGQTYFARMSFTAAECRVKLDSTETPVELRVAWLGWYDNAGATSQTNTALNYITGGELVLTKADGTVLLSAKANSKHLYDSMGFRVGGYTASSANERFRVFCMDISSLTANQIADLRTNGCKIAVRFNFQNPYNTLANGSRASTLWVNSFVVTWSSNSSASAARRRRGTQLLLG